jgi:tRNA A-37 threonylcarbamoyl transferase component Bud32
MMREKNPDGTPRYATREAAEAALKRMLKRDDALPPGIASGADIRYAAMDIGWRGTGGAQDAWEFLQGTGQFNGLVRPTTGTPRARRSRGRRDRTDVNEDKSEAHHAAYMATRLDLKATSTGQKCGNSYIPKSYKCRRGTAASIPSKAPTNKTEAKLKSSFNTKLLIGGTALVGLSALAAAGIDDVVRTRSRQFGEPTFKTFAETIGEPGKFNAATKKRLSAGAFGETSLVQLDGKTYVVKNPKMPSKEMRRAMSTGIDDKATKNLYRAQGRMTHSEVSNARLAAEIGVAPKVIAANKNTLVTEVAKGEPAKKITRDNREQLHTTLAKLHRAGIAHNDLKPDNFFVDKESGSIQLIDFGLSMRSSSGVAREWYRAMNPESPNPFIRITGTATGSFNLRELNPKGYERAETALRQVIKGEVNEDNIISAGKDPKIARQMQLVINNYYLGRYNYASLTESRRNGRR